MSDQPLKLPADDPPKDGKWVDLHDEPLSEEEQMAGKKLGEDIDTEDDEDNGGVE